jgi:lysophospholipase L1-like esterase
MMVLTASLHAAQRSIPAFIFLGASNMDSRRAAVEDLPAYLKPAQTDVYYSYSLDSGAFSSIGFLRPVTNAAYSSSPSLTGFGADITTGRQLADSLGSEIAVIKNGRGSATLADHFGVGDVEYTKIVAAFSSMRAYLAGLTPAATTTAVAVFMQLGENDIVDDAKTAAFATNLTALINGLRTDLGNSNLLFVIQETWSPEGTAKWPAKQLTVENAQRAAAAADPRIGIFGVKDLTFSSDAVHFTSASELTIGDRFFAVYQSMTAPAGQGPRAP